MNDNRRKKKISYFSLALLICSALGLGNKCLISPQMAEGTRITTTPQLTAPNPYPDSRLVGSHKRQHVVRGGPLPALMLTDSYIVEDVSLEGGIAHFSQQSDKLAQTRSLVKGAETPAYEVQFGPEGYSNITILRELNTPCVGKTFYVLIDDYGTDTVRYKTKSFEFTPDDA